MLGMLVNLLSLLLLSVGVLWVGPTLRVWWTLLSFCTGAAIGRSRALAHVLLCSEFRHGKWMSVQTNKFLCDQIFFSLRLCKKGTSYFSGFHLERNKCNSCHNYGAECRQWTKKFRSLYLFTGPFKYVPFI
jgi:hypothetical protein